MSREYKIGIVVAAALGMLYWGGSFLSGSNPFKSKTEFHAIYEKVDGLLVSNQVRYKGFKVGRVSSITFSPQLNKWVVTFSVDEKTIVVKDGAKAVIGSADILGTMVIKLEDIGSGSKSMLPGDTISSSIEKGLQTQVNEQLRPLVYKVEGLIGSVDSVINVVTVLLDENTIKNVHASMEKIPVMMKTLLHATKETDSILTSVNGARLGETIDNINSITENLSRNNRVLTSIFKNVNAITDSIAKSNVKQTFNNLSTVLAKVDSITGDIQSGKGSLGLLLKDEKLYNDLAYSAADLDLLLFDLRQHPKRYFHFSMFGKKEKKKKALKRDTAEYNTMFPPVVRQMVKFELDSALRKEIREMLNEQRSK